MILVLATRNQGKVREIAKVLDLPRLRIQSLQDFPDLPVVVEDGRTFQENAFKKARACAQALEKIRVHLWKNLKTTGA